MIISDEHYNYLLIQKGDVAQYCGDRKVWEEKYEAALHSIYNNIKPYLPDDTWNSILDVGSGLGGIDIILYHHYLNKGNKPHIALLDGTDDSPVVVKHAETFSNADVALSFLTTNGLNSCDCSFLSPEGCTKPRFDMDLRFSLVVSFASYCFHFSPKVYLDFIRSTTTPKCVFIFDVRKNKPEWLQMLKDGLKFKTKIHDAAKWERLVFTK